MENKNINFSSDSTENSIDLKQIIVQYLYYWKWMLLSLIVFIAAAKVYLRYATPIYSVSARVLLVDEKSSSELSGLSELSLMSGGSFSGSNVNDQIDVIKSRRLFRKVVEAGRLNYSYFVAGKIKKDEVLESELPFKVLFLDSSSSTDKSMVLPIRVTEKNVVVSVKGKDISAEYGEKVNTSIGPLIFTKNINIINSENYELVVSSVESTVSNLLNAITIAPKAGGQSNILVFSMNYPNVAKAELILNTLIDQYNVDVTDDKVKLTKSTRDFIQSRLDNVSKDLKQSDSNLASFKNANHTVNMESEADLFFQNSSASEEKIVEYETQYRLAKLMSENINDEFVLLPSNIGISEPSIAANVSNYNTLVLEREDLLKSATLDNPVIKNLDRNLLEIKANIVASLGNYIKILNANLNSIKEQKGKFDQKLSSLPSKEMGFKDLSRQQQIVESLYLFLLEKREENEIKASATPTNIKVIDYAYGGFLVSPNSRMINFAALLLGLLVPIGILFVKFLLDNKVHSRKDLESFIKAPILGEIPTTDDTHIRDNDRSSLAEAFRILRTNISFMLGARKGFSSVIFVTSTTSGEGKSFVSTNLARILAMSNKRVLLVGADIRSPKVLDYLGLSHLHHTNIGITQYLINPEMDIDSIIIKKPEPYKFDIIYSGYIAPNPAELLMNGYFENIIEYGRNNYDYIIVDTAPVSLVTDTLLISEFADLTIYVTRANYLEKRMLNVPKDLYEEGKLRNMAFVLNDVDFARGYGYGYGYGYGEQKEDKSFGARIIKALKNLFSSKKG